MELSKYFIIKGYFLFGYKDNGKYKSIEKWFSFSKCELEEIDNDFKYFLRSEEKESVTTLCPRNLYSKELKV
jgi:hypothetical protein